ncbi:hypothetical protein BV372_09895 [Nostoc sp. T09]|nr:hypothetical protein BV372_09895 [Nostoc sp. T09]
MFVAIRTATVVQVLSSHGNNFPTLKLAQTQAEIPLSKVRILKILRCLQQASASRSVPPCFTPVFYLDFRLKSTK